MFERYHEIRKAQATSDEAGFTLIELLIVIVVLGILAAVVIFGLSGVTGQSAQAACNADAKSVEIAEEAYHTVHGSFTATQTDLTNADPLINGGRFLRTFPNNATHYTVSIANAVTANGEVDVTPTGGTAANYDTLTGTPPVNVCASVK